MAVDQRIIQYAVKTKYDKIDGFEISDDYIEKIIQLPIKIPELSPKDIENYLLLLICQLHINEDMFSMIIDDIYEKKKLLSDKPVSLDEIRGFIAEKNIKDYTDNEQDFIADANTIEKIRSIVSSSLKGNPRQAKRFLNTFFVRKNLSVLYFGDELEVSIIAKLLALEIIDIDLFKKLNEWHKISGGEIEQMKKLEEYAKYESGEIDQELRRWTKARVINWLKSEPTELYKKDLSKYFYLSRESLSYSDDMITTFSDKERKLLESMLSCVKGQEANKIEELKQAEFDTQQKIIKVLLNKFALSEVELSFVSEIYVQYSDFQTDICDQIKLMEGKLFTYGAVPHFKKMKNSNDQQILELVEYLQANKKMAPEIASMIKEMEVVATAVKRDGDY